MSDSPAIILNLDQQPFENFDLAAKMRDLLINESKHHYRVELFEADNETAGFIVKRTNNEQQPPNEDGKPEHLNIQKNLQSTKQQSDLISEVQNKTYHPALRTYLLQTPLALVELVMVLFPVELWIVILSVTGIKGLPLWIDGDWLVNSTQIVGTVCLVWQLSGILINYYGTALVIDSRGISYKQGLLTRDIINVRFAEIRTIGLRQGILDRLLNIGILEFASSGTDDVDIRFINIANPAGVKAEIEAIIEQQIH